MVSGIPAMVALPAGIWLAGHHLAAVTAALPAGVWLAGHHLAAVTAAPAGAVTAALAGGAPSA